MNRFRAVWALGAVVLTVALSAARPVGAQTSILVVDPDAGKKKLGALFAIDELGNRRILSDFGNIFQGDLGADPIEVAVQPGGLILVLDVGAGTKGRGALFAVDADTGRRRIVSDFGDASEGPRAGEPGDTFPGVTGLTVLPDGRALVADFTSDQPGGCPFPRRCGSIYAIAPDGRRTVFRNYNAPDGPGPVGPTTVAAQPDGAVLVGTRFYYGGNGVTPSDATVTRIAPDGLAESVVSKFGAQEVFSSFPRGLATESSGEVLVTVRGKLYRANPATMAHQLLVDLDPLEGGVRSIEAWGVAVGKSGKILVAVRRFDPTAQPAIARLMSVDPATGAATLLSDFTNPAQGPTGVAPSGIAFLGPYPKEGELIVSDYRAGTDTRGSLFIVDPSTGDRRLFSDFGDPSQGVLGSSPYGVALDPGGRIWVIDQRAGSGCSSGCGALFFVDPLTGARELRSDFGNGAQGPTGVKLLGITIDRNGDVLVADLFGGALFRVNPVSGAREIIAGFERSTDVAVMASGDLLVTHILPATSLSRIPAGTNTPVLLTNFADAMQGTPPGIVPTAVTEDATGRILVVDQTANLASAVMGFGLLYEVDPATGNFTVVTDFTDETQGPLGWNPSDVVVDASGNILVTDFDGGADFDRGAVLIVDAVTGNRTILSDFGDATEGPLGLEPSGIAIFTSPIGFPGVDVRDLALTKIVVPATVKLTAAKPVVVKNVKVQIQNRGTRPVVVSNLNALVALVDLDVVSLGACTAPLPSLVAPTKLPITLKSKQRLTLGYNVTFGCANDLLKSSKNAHDHDDYDFTARVVHGAVGGADQHVVDDVCPRSVVPPYVIDPYPNGKIKDKGCGSTKPDRTLGGPVRVDVVQ